MPVCDICSIPHGYVTPLIHPSLGLTGTTLSPAHPDSVQRFDQVYALPQPRYILFLSASVRPWYAPWFLAQIGRRYLGSGPPATESVLYPRISAPPPTARIGSVHIKSGAVPSAPGTPLLNISFINSARFRKYARNNKPTALWYHLSGLRGYSVTIASLQTASDESQSPISTPSSTTPSPAPPPKPPPSDNDYLQHVTAKYHNFHSVFSPVEVENLPPHRPGFNAAIELEDGKSPPLGPLYHLSQQEHEVLFNYIETNLRKGFIWCSTSSATSPVLFV